MHNMQVVLYKLQIMYVGSCPWLDIGGRSATKYWYNIMYYSRIYLMLSNVYFLYIQNVCTKTYILKYIPYIPNHPRLRLSTVFALCWR